MRVVIHLYSDNPANVESYEVNVVTCPRIHEEIVLRHGEPYVVTRVVHDMTGEISVPTVYAIKKA